MNYKNIRRILLRLKDIPFFLSAALVTMLLCVYPAAAASDAALSRDVTLTAESLSSEQETAETDTGTVIGTTTETLSSLSGSGSLTDESTLGDAIADAMCLVTGADVAILCGGDIEDCAMPAGEQTAESIRDAIASDTQIGISQVTPKALYEILEVGVGSIVIDSETTEILREESEFYGFPQVAGMSFYYDAGAPAGSRLIRITIDGEELDAEDEETLLTLAASTQLLSGEYGYPQTAYEETGILLSEALSDYVSSGITTRYASEDRMSIHGTTEDTIISKIPFGVLILLVVLFAVGNGVRRMRTDQDERDHDNDPDWGMY